MRKSLSLILLVFLFLSCGEGRILDTVNDDEVFFEYSDVNWEYETEHKQTDHAEILAYWATGDTTVVPDLTSSSQIGSSSNQISNSSSNPLPSSVIFSSSKPISSTVISSSTIFSSSSVPVSVSSSISSSTAISSSSSIIIVSSSSIPVSSSSSIISSSSIASSSSVGGLCTQGTCWDNPVTVPMTTTLSFVTHPSPMYVRFTGATSSSLHTGIQHTGTQWNMSLDLCGTVKASNGGQWYKDITGPNGCTDVIFTWVSGATTFTPSGGWW